MKVRPVIALLAVVSACAFALDVKAGGQSPQPPAKAQAAGAVFTETDSDGDGRIDYSVYFLKTGQKEHEEFDYNKDSVMDDFLYYVEGLLSREEIDSNYDGKIDIRVFLSEGKYIKRYERDLDGDGVADVIKDYDKK